MLRKFAIPVMLTASVACSGAPRPGSPEFARDHETHLFALAANVTVAEEAQLAGGRGTREAVRVLGQHLMADHGRSLAAHNDMSSLFQTNPGLGDEGRNLKYIRGDIGRTRALPAPPAESDLVYTINRAALDASPTSAEVMRNHEEALTVLRGTDDAAFDRAFLERQVTIHQYLIAKIDQMLPAVSTEALRQQLELDRAALETHLRMAKSLMYEP